MNIADHIGTVPDFPKPGILFYDVSTLLAHPPAWKETCDQLAKAIGPWQPDVLAGIESRGFLTAAPLALALGRAFVMVRKKGKLPGAVVDYTYDLEYGTDTVEIQAQGVQPGQKVVVLDDLLATGGTMNAAVQLFRKVGAEVVGCACIMELTFLGGRDKLDVPCETLVKFDS